VALEWKHSIDGVDWKELSALYRAAPLGDKKPLHLQTVFSNSMFRCFVYDNARLVAAFGFLRMNTAMAIFVNQQQQLERGYLSEA
jgi:hypothetical protein